MKVPFAPLLLATALTACANLPDERLAREAYARGDVATAESNYRQLAALGYADASVGLADIQVDSGDPAQLAEAERIYRSAIDRSPRAQGRLGRLLARKPDATVAEHHEAEQLLQSAFEGGETGSLMPLTLLYLQHPQSFPDVDVQQRIAQWRAEGYPQAGLAQIALYRIQGTYADHLDEVERICAGQERVMDACYAEMVSVYQIRGQQEPRDALIEQLRGDYRAGVVSASRVDNVADVLSDASLGNPDPQQAQALLESLAPDYPAAWVSLARLLYDYPNLGDEAQMFDYLERGQAASQSRAELLLGRLYYEGKWVPQDPHKAESHLQTAIDQGELQGHYYLGQLYRRGYLGDPEPQKAVDHLLTAARGGVGGADFAIAQIFSQDRGVRPDPVNAWLFAQLAERLDAARAEPLLAELDAQMTPAQKAQAQRRLQAEEQARGAAWQAAVEQSMAAAPSPSESAAVQESL